MSDTHSTDGQNHVETQETVEDTAAYKPTWIEPVEQKSEVEEEAEQTAPVKESKVKVKKKATVTKKKKATVAKKPSLRGKPAELDEFGFRKGSLRSKAAQLYASDKGATLDEVKKKCGSVQYNMLTELKKRGFKILTKEIEGKANRPATKYFLKSKKR